MANMRARVQKQNVFLIVCQMGIIVGQVLNAVAANQTYTFHTVCPTKDFPHKILSHQKGIKVLYAILRFVYYYD